MSTMRQSQTVEEIKKEAIDEMMQRDGKPRFGLFSSPRAGVLGDPQFTIQPRRGPDGKVITKPRPIMAAAPKTGKLRNSFFTDVGYTSIGDLYIEPDRIERQYQMKKNKNSPIKDKFRPVVLTNIDPVNALYEHKSDLAAKKPNFKVVDRRVITEQRGIFTSPAKSGHYTSTVGHLFGPVVKYSSDPFDSKKMAEYKLQLEGKKKMQRDPWKNASYSGEPFSDNQAAFGRDYTKLPEHQSKSPGVRQAAHGEAFRPAGMQKKFLQGTFNMFPEHVSSPIHQAVRKIEVNENRKDAFKPVTSITPSRPTPSITLNKANIKRELASSASLHLF